MTVSAAVVIPGAWSGSAATAQRVPDPTFASAISFGTTPTFPAGDGPFSVAVGDLDGGVHADLAVADRFSNGVSVLLGDGRGSFGARSVRAVGGSPRSIATGDLDGDGILDLTAANLASGGVSALLSADSPACAWQESNLRPRD